MKIILAYAAMVLLVTGCASTQEGAPASSAAPAADAPVAVAAPAADASSGKGFYTVGQARRGGGLFRDSCESCHSSSEFNDSSFKRRWGNKAVGDLYDFVLYSMPDDNPGGLPEQTYVDIIAYVLQSNDFPAGETELPTSMEVLMQIMLSEDPIGGGDR